MKGHLVISSNVPKENEKHLSNENTLLSMTHFHIKELLQQIKI